MCVFLLTVCRRKSRQDNDDDGDDSVGKQTLELLPWMECLVLRHSETCHGVFSRLSVMYTHTREEEEEKGVLPAGRRRGHPASSSSFRLNVSLKGGGTVEQDCRLSLLSKQLPVRTVHTTTCKGTLYIFSQLVFVW